MEEVERKRAPQSGSRAAGRSPRAKRSGRKRIETEVKENETGNVRKSVKRRRKKNDSEQEIIPFNAWARLLLEHGGDPCGSGGSGAQAQRVQVVRTDTLRLLTTPELGDFPAACRRCCGSLDQHGEF
jgi:hypothetical protein